MLVVCFPCCSFSGISSDLQLTEESRESSDKTTITAFMEKLPCKGQFLTIGNRQVLCSEIERRPGEGSLRYKVDHVSGCALLISVLRQLGAFQHAQRHSRRCVPRKRSS